MGRCVEDTADMGGPDRTESLEDTDEFLDLLGEHARAEERERRNKMWVGGAVALLYTLLCGWLAGLWLTLILVGLPVFLIGTILWFRRSSYLSEVPRRFTAPMAIIGAILVVVGVVLALRPGILPTYATPEPDPPPLVPGATSEAPAPVTPASPPPSEEPPMGEPPADAPQPEAPQEPGEGEPDPEQPAPGQPQPEQPQPEQPQPEQPAPGQPQPEQPAPEQPQPEQPQPEQPQPEQPQPEQPAPGQPQPEQPAPERSGPVVSQPAQPIPGESASGNPAPEQSVADGHRYLEGSETGPPDHASSRGDSPRYRVQAPLYMA